MALTFSYIKEWFPFILILAGVVLALVAIFLRPGKQTRNRTLHMLEAFRESLHEHDIEHWKEVYHGRREVVAAPAGHFINRIGKPVPLVSMWTSGNDDHTAIQRMAESLEAVCAEILTHTLDMKMLWYEIGQLLCATHDWLEDIPGVQQDASFLDEQYPFHKQVFEKYGNQFKKWPCRVYA